MQRQHVAHLGLNKFAAEVREMDDGRKGKEIVIFETVRLGGSLTFTDVPKSPIVQLCPCRTLREECIVTHLCVQTALVMPVSHTLSWREHG